MKAQFTFLSGARAGQTDVLSQPTINIGRHPQSELRFDSDRDLDVSSRHAVITTLGDMYVLRDLGSTNGTVVNGRRLTTDHVLASKDVLRFGLNGPQVEFTAIPGPVRSPAAAPPPANGTIVYGGAWVASEPTPPPPGPPPTPPLRAAAPGTPTRGRVEVARQTRRLRSTAVGLFLLLMVLSGAYLWQLRVTSQRLAAQRHFLLAQVDSLMGEIDLISTGSVGLRAALDSAQAAAPNDAATINALRRQLDQAMRQQRTLAGAVALDVRGIAADNRDAIAIVFVEFPNHQVFTGTAFAIRSDATGGLLITNKHVVTDPNGAIATRIGVAFEGSRQNFRADLVRVSEKTDLALLRASVHRGFPTVKTLADSLRPAEVGEPVLVLGFPLGLDLAGGRDWTQSGVSATLTLGTVSRTQPELLQLDGYGAQGSSGSPVFDKYGKVIGVIYGGETGSNGRILYGVPVRFVHQLLAGQ